MEQYWLAVGTRGNWETSFSSGNLWGLKDFREVAALWNLLREGDKVLLYCSKPVSGIVGCATVVTKFRQTVPLWPDEIKRHQVIWPLRFEFDVEYCLSPSLWEERAYRDAQLQMVTRMIFQCVPTSIAEAVREHSALAPPRWIRRASETPPIVSPNNSREVSHDRIKEQLLEIGQLQGFCAEKEFAIEGNRLDVVWRRVERSVPTYAFEVQVAGDIYHALGKLKVAHDLWNSRIFVAGNHECRRKFEGLTASTFREIANRVRYIDIEIIADLHKRKTEYKQLETNLGIFP